MFRLYAGHYEAVTAQRFQHDLADKTVVLLLYDSHGELGGFSTLAIDDIAFAGRTYRVLFSGDTLIEPAYWGCHEFAFAWLRLAGRIKAGCQERPLIWFLIVKGHRTYRYLHVFAKTFHPREGEHDASLAALASHLARQQFHEDYNPASGLVEFVPSRGQLKQDLAEPRPDEMSRTGVAYFLQRNPGFKLGHELVCVCDVEEDNMKPMTLRLFRQGFNASTQEP